MGLNCFVSKTDFDVIQSFKVKRYFIVRCSIYTKKKE